VPRRLAATHLHVVAVEGDVDGAEGRRIARALLDEPAEALRERDAARLDPDERDPVDVWVALDDLVGDPGEGPGQRLCVEEDLLGGGSPGAQGAGRAEGMRAGSFIRLLSGLTGPG
jgi:hypothetical protein